MRAFRAKFFKKATSLFLAITVLTSASTCVMAETNTSTTPEPATLQDYLSYAFGTAENIEKFEDEFGITFETKPYDFIENSNFAFTEEWLADADSFATSYVNENTSARSRSTYVPTSTQSAKANAIAYSIDRALISVERNKNNNNIINLNKEAQYMFMSHYVDRPEYYWSTKDERYLLDGPSMSGEDGYLADWLTGTDRQSYSLYMGVTSTSKNMELIGNMADGFASARGEAAALHKGVDALKNTNRVLKTASSINFKDESLNAIDVMKTDVAPAVAQAILRLLNDNATKISILYDEFMNDEGFLAFHNEEDKDSIIKTALSLVASFAVGGLVGGLEGIAFNALKFEFDVFNTYFRYAAWVSMRYGFSGRYANRTSYYIGM